MESLVLVRQEGASRILSLNRPDVRNALSQGLQVALGGALEQAINDPKTRSIVITGEGKAFCAGLDLSELQAIRERSSEENRADSARFAALLERIYTSPKPCIAAVNGHAVAGGAGIASVCDLVVMNENAKIGYTESKIGFVAALVAVFLSRIVGEKHCRDLLLTGRLISAQEAQDIGLVNEVCPPDQVLGRALDLANVLNSNAPTSLAMSKQLLAALPSMGLREGLNYASEVNALARSTDNLREGISAFLEKRSPSY